MRWNQQTVYQQFRKLADGVDPPESKVIGKDEIAHHLVMMARIYSRGLITRETYLAICKDLLSGE